MKRTDEKVADARRLRLRGYSNREIAAALGISHETARRWLNPDAARRHRLSAAAWRRRNRERNRAYFGTYNRTRARRGSCQTCGGLMGYRKDGTCAACRHAEFEQRMRTLVALWAEGKSTAAIAKVLGMTPSALQSKMVRYRAAGYPLPYRASRRSTA